MDKLPGCLANRINLYFRWFNLLFIATKVKGNKGPVKIKSVNGVKLSVSCCREPAKGIFLEEETGHTPKFIQIRS